jgi:hypothetical protein
MGIAQGTLKRWLHEGMPAERINKHDVWIDPTAAKAWIEERFKGKKTIAFGRHAVVYFAKREDGKIKIGWTSDVMRRIFELRKYMRCAVELMACFPGNKRTENSLHRRFSTVPHEREWYEPDAVLLSFIEQIGGMS